MPNSSPTLDEVALGGFFEDIGKFMQRAFGATSAMDPATRARDFEILPRDGRGGYTHKHALWTEAFFDWMEKQKLSFPNGIRLGHVREAAVYHHHPRTALHWLSAVADRLSAGMDRAAKDDAADHAETSKAWDAFRKQPLGCIFDQIQIGRGNQPKPMAYSLVSLTPEAMFPSRIAGEELPSLYAKAWKGFCDDFAALCRQPLSADLFQQGLLSLSERYTWAIPSSTIDDPDVSLHDHNRTVAAFAACLYRHHEARGELNDEAAIKDAERPKFHVLIGDLSGIQTSLFRLKSEGVKGVNRVLRARSFLIGQLGDGAALLCRQRFALPPWCVLQNAGGRFQILLPVVPDIDDGIEALRQQIDAWMLDHYTGDLILNLAVTPPLAAHDFRADKFPQTLSVIAAVTDAAKQAPLATRVTRTGDPRIEIDFPAVGACSVCGVRPAKPGPAEANLCSTCAEDEQLGSAVPKADMVLLSKRSSGNALFGELSLTVPAAAPAPGHQSKLVAGFRVWGRGTGAFPPAERFLANYVPHLAEGDGDHSRYDGLADAADVRVGQIKVFEQLAADALEWHENRFVGRAMLAVLKADVDDLGLVFGCGLERKRTTLGRVSQLSRMMDGFFTGYLPYLLETKFRNTYTVYAGGDDLLLIAPWYSGIKLAQHLRADFGRFVNNNPNLTLSAGIEFCSVNEPLNRAVRRAEAKLELAKSHKQKSGQVTKDRVTLIVDDHSIPWTGGVGSLDWALQEAEWLNEHIRSGHLPTTFLHRMLDLDRLRRQSERDNPSGDLAWRAKWGYHLGRLIERLKKTDQPQEIGRRLDGLMSGRLCDGTSAGGGPVAEAPDPRIPLSIALYRNR